MIAHLFVAQNRAHSVDPKRPPLTDVKNDRGVLLRVSFPYRRSLIFLPGLSIHEGRIFYSLLKRYPVVLSVRPKVAELAFHVFSRTLHPELYTIHKTRLVERGAYQARIDITNCGHVVTWNVDVGASLPANPSATSASKENQNSGSHPPNFEPDEVRRNNLEPSSFFPNSDGKNLLTLCEVATSAHQPLPKRRRLISNSLKGSRTERAQCRSGVSYRTHFQLEPVSPDLFWMVQQQLGHGSTEGLVHHFDASGRMALGAMSYVSIETRERSMRIQAIHTFPDDYAIVKVESLFSVGNSTS